MAWRAVYEPHLLNIGTDDSGSLQLQPLAYVRTLRRVTSGLNYGYDGQVGVGAIIPNMRAPDLTLSLEGMAPNDPSFIAKLISAKAYADMPPTPDPSYTDTFSYLANVNAAATVDGIVLHFGLAPRRLQFTLSDAGLEMSAEYAVADVSVAQGVVEYDSVNAVVTARYVKLLNPTWAPEQINVAGGVSQTVLDEVFPPEVARTAGVLTVYDASGAQYDLIPTRIQITAEFNGTIAYGVNKTAVTLKRLVPYITVEVELAPDMLTPADKFKAGIVKSTTPAVLGVSGFMTIEATEYIIQAGDFEVSDDFTNPRLTIIPMKYVLKDGNGNAVAGWT